MYLALLAGGQIIKKIVKKTLGISGPDGLEIFEFPGDRVTLKKKIISNINKLTLTEEEKEDIIREKLLIFQMNNRIADSVTPTAGSFSRLCKFLVLFLVVLVFIIYMFLMFAT